MLRKAFLKTLSLTKCGFNKDLKTAMFFSCCPLLPPHDKVTYKRQKKAEKQRLSVREGLSVNEKGERYTEGEKRKKEKTF